MTAKQGCRVLFLCTGNSARSILAEAIGQRLAPPGIEFHSAGSAPTGAVHPGAIQELRRRGHDIGSYRSKSWDEFSAAAAPCLNWVITLCDNAASETCPVFPGRYAEAHWGLPDPATGAATFTHTYDQLQQKIADFIREISAES